MVGMTIGAALLYSLIAQPMGWPGRMETWGSRIMAFVTPEEYPDEARQPDIAQITILEGAFDPQGPGESFARYVLPQAQSDYIFALIVGEWSILAGLLVIALYIAVLYRGILIVQKAEHAFMAFLALGYTLMITMQAFMHIIVTVGLGPATGQPLPLVSMGGTSFLISSFAMGIILNASYHAKRQDAKRKKT